MKSDLFEAVASNDITSIKQICAEGFDAKYWVYWAPSIEWGDLCGVIEKAVETQNIEILKILLESDEGKINDVKYYHVIIGMVMSYRLPNLFMSDIFWIFLENNNCEVEDEDMTRFLASAVFSGDVNAVQHILKRGANINCLTGWGSPLTIAVSENNLSLVKLLIEEGADPNFNNEEENAGCGSLATAARENFLEIYQYLLPLVSNKDEIEYSKLLISGIAPTLTSQFADFVETQQG